MDTLLHNPINDMGHMITQCIYLLILILNDSILFYDLNQYVLIFPGPYPFSDLIIQRIEEETSG